MKILTGSVSLRSGCKRFEPLSPDDLKDNQIVYTIMWKQGGWTGELFKSSFLTPGFVIKEAIYKAKDQFAYFELNGTSENIIQDLEDLKAYGFDRSKAYGIKGYSIGCKSLNEVWLNKQEAQDIIDSYYEELRKFDMRSCLLSEPLMRETTNNVYTDIQYGES